MVGVVGVCRSMCRACNAMSKKPTQLSGLETSPCGVPRSRWKVHGLSREGVVPNPWAAVRAQVWRAHGERMTVGPPTSMVASHRAMSVGTPRRVQLISMAPRGTETKALRMSQLEE